MKSKDKLLQWHNSVFHLPEQGEGCQTSEHSLDFYGRHHQGNYSEKKNYKILSLTLVKVTKIFVNRQNLLMLY